MSKYPVVVRKNKIRQVDPGAAEIVEPASNLGPFISFQHSYTEISVQGGRARVKSMQTRQEDGKLVSETFEGELDRSAYDRTVSQAEQRILGRAALFLRSLFLPSSRRAPSDDD